MKVAIVSTGEELLTGETVDTNSSWLAAAVWERGAEVRRMVTSGDDLQGVIWAIEQATEHADLVICTGGLGPTEDDRTAEAISAWTGVERVEDAEALRQIEHRYASMGRVMAESNRKQAFLPAQATIFENKWGTAPAFSVEHAGSIVVCLPGVPYEMRELFHHHVLPLLQIDEPPTLVRVRTFGLGESQIQNMLDGLDMGGAVLGFRAHLPEVQIKLHFPFSVKSAERTLVVERVCQRLSKWVYCVDGGDLAETLVGVLSDAGETVALAESCTAGLVSAWIADVPGASAVLEEGAIVYSNESKTRAVGVDPNLVTTHGAVSEPVSRALAEGIRSRSGATWGIGITGIAGPGGGSDTKPVGTVHIAVAGPNGVFHQHAVIPGNRGQVRRRAAGGALALLLRSRPVGPLDG
ncbi:MAG: damage-inducible protein CinA [Deltaproteobacteria bacterium]|nr:damage-inducible protein CinA [Deltaproteobacteria bacterium]